MTLVRKNWQEGQTGLETRVRKINKENWIRLPLLHKKASA